MTTPDYAASTDNNQKLMALAVEASPNGMVMIDGEGMIMMINSSIESLFGYDRSELLGQPLEILVPERFRQLHPSLRNDYFNEPRSRAMGHGRDLYGVHKNGTEIPVEIGLNPIKIGDKTLVLAAIVDITERQRGQEMMRLAVEAAPNGMILTSPDGRIALVNSFAENLFGYSREELIGNDIDILVPVRFRSNHPHMRAQYHGAPVSRAMGKGRDLYALHKNGREFPVEIGLNPLHMAQGTMILASIVDITERKQQEESLRSALKEKEVLLSEIHHRVKNNLQIIDSLIGMQSDRVLNEQAINILKDSQNRVRSIAMIHQILYQSQDFSQVNVADVVKSLVDNIAQSYGIESSRISIAMDIDSIFMPIDRSIPLGLTINELVSNTFKHGFPDHRTGKVNISLKNGKNHSLRLIVEDNGIGIPDDYDISTSDSLGLLLVKALTDQLGGELKVNRSNPTRFELDFERGPVH